MTNVYIASEKITCIGELNGTLGCLFVVEFCNKLIFGLINDIDASVFGEGIIGHTRGDYCPV